MTQPPKPLARCYACGKLATHKVSDALSKCRECHDRDRADPWGAVARVIDETFRIAKGGRR